MICRCGKALRSALDVDDLPSGNDPTPLWSRSSPMDVSSSREDRLWQTFLRRFDREHTFRSFDQPLGWTVPRPPTLRRSSVNTVSAAETTRRVREHKEPNRNDARSGPSSMPARRLRVADNPAHGRSPPPPNAASARRHTRPGPPRTGVRAHVNLYADTPPPPHRTTMTCSGRPHSADRGSLMPGPRPASACRRQREGGAATAVVPARHAASEECGQSTVPCGNPRGSRETAAAPRRG